MADDEQQKPEQVAWDRVGQFFGDMATVAQKVGERNLTLWSNVSNSIRREAYDADAMARDAAKAMSVALNNVDDIWALLTRVPERERVATPLPTAFMLFPEQHPEPAVNAIPDPVWIRVSPATDLKDLPRHAAIGLSGPKQGVTEVRDRLRATLDPPRGYKLEASAKGTEKLHPGVYSGIIYISGAPARPLATLRVVVEGTAGDLGDEPESLVY